MDIRNIRALKDTAAQRVASAREPAQLVLRYALVTALSSLVVTAVNYALGLQIEQSTGLSSLGLNSMLSTIQTVLPIILSFALLAWEFGYLFTTLRMAREQEVNTRMLPFGFQRFWPLFRLTLLRGLLYGGIGILSFNLSMVIFLMTPLSADFMELLAPMMAEMSSLDPTAAVDIMALDAATLDTLYLAMIPYFVVFILLYLVMVLPVSYSLRMASYCLLDHPQAGALSAMRESRGMMRRNRFALFKLDVSYWWYYLLLSAATLIGYGDMLLPLLGMELPFSAEIGYFLFYILFLAAELGIYYAFRNKLEVTYALAYEAIRPRPVEKDNGVILGNIFDI